ncbi:MAG TPA: chemotaxis protein CheW [Longimicrobium sp.]|nr:chemotaxis protein CheW [Longimicrobium sp.]
MSHDESGAAAAAASEPFILFDLAGATYGVRSREVQQLEMIGDVTPVPNAPPFVDGVVSVRGQVVPVVSLRSRFGFPRVPFDLRSRLLVMRREGRTVAFAVDSAREFATIAADAIQPPPEGISGLNGRYLEGLAHLGGRLVLILDTADLFSPDGGEASPLPAEPAKES